MQDATLELPLGLTGAPASVPDLRAEIEAFREFGKPTTIERTSISANGSGTITLPIYTNEFWTAKQRQASSLHEISYRACFKPQLPRFFIERLTTQGDIVYDPFMGRGTTPLEAALLGRVPFGNDVNPLSLTMTQPRLRPPSLEEISSRLKSIPYDQPGEMPEELLVFYHSDTLRSISSLRRYLLGRMSAGGADAVDDWIAMVALNRLTGHSKGFFSVYTLPPNQATSVKAQIRINAKRNQTPEPRDVAKIILKKSRQLLGDVGGDNLQVLQRANHAAKLLTGPASFTPSIASNSVALVVTSPPFLNVVQYAADNWLRCWFLGIDAKAVKLTLPSSLDSWSAFMEEVLREVHRVLKPGGHVAWEVGEVHKGQTRLEEKVLPAGVKVGLEPVLVLINDQDFTKTANCWGVDNMSKGTNTNRIVLFRKR